MTTPEAGHDIPITLWLEAAHIAIYLYNHTPLNARLKDNNEMTSLDKILASWFRSYFRWYNPELVNRIIADLRPN